MPKYRVSVERRMYATGSVVVLADSPEEAQAAVDRRIDSGVLQTTGVEWGDAQYEDCSFATTGDIDVE